MCEGRQWRGSPRASLHAQVQSRRYDVNVVVDVRRYRVGVRSYEADGLSLRPRSAAGSRGRTWTQGPTAVLVHLVARVQESLSLSDSNIDRHPRVSAGQALAVGLESGVAEPGLYRADSLLGWLKERRNLASTPVLSVRGR